MDTQNDIEIEVEPLNANDASAASANDAFAAPKIILTLPEEDEVADAYIIPGGTATQALDYSGLTDEEQKAVAEFAEKIDLNNSAIVLQYGAGTQKKMADFADTALEKVRTKDMGEIGSELSSLVQELKGFEIEENERGPLAFFKKQANKVNNLKVRYAKAESNIDEVTKVLEARQIELLKDVGTLDKMYETNLQYFKELSMYILAGKQKLEQVRSTELQELIKKAELTGLPEDAQAAKDLEDRCIRFEKKIHDLDLSRTISLQTAPQIRLVQNNDTIMAEKIQSTLVNTIPVWKSQMVIALGLEHSQQAAKAQREVTDMTNELLKKNAKALKQATVDTAKESERGIVDISTLRSTNEMLISTLDEVVRIQNEGRAARAEAEADLARLENELKEKLIEMSR